MFCMRCDIQLTASPFRHGCYLGLFYRSETEAQRGEANCPRSHSEKMKELGFKSRPMNPQLASPSRHPVTLSKKISISKRGCPGSRGNSSRAEGAKYCLALGGMLCPRISGSYSPNQVESGPLHSFLLLHGLSIRSLSSATYK